MGEAYDTSIRRQGAGRNRHAGGGVGLSAMRAVAFYLPQFHPTPENDAWWGKGFTEWTNVTRAGRLFRGHYQPRLPTDLGFYDLRLGEVREQQARLAREHGIHGFCYYHYWFGGKRLLHRPLDDMLASRRPDFPFLLCWANETWSRRWLGEDKEILIRQEYSEADDLRHARWLSEHVFSDERCIRIGGRPAFVIYRPPVLPDQARTIDVFKQVAVKSGLAEPYVIATNAHAPRLDGFDGVLDFLPQFGFVRGAVSDGLRPRRFLRNLKLGIVAADLKVYDYGEVVRTMMARTFPYRYFPGAFVGWDNSARRGRNGVILQNQNTADVKASLIHARTLAEKLPAEEQLVFLNAWNEWAEGNHLEPCRKFGTSFLETVKEVFDPGPASRG